MHTEHPRPWQHSHDFGMDRVRAGERRTLIVVIVTACFMVAEIAGGLLFGSMALLADGLHMGSHAVALGISLGAYVYARRRAHDQRFSFGVGKVNALAGFTGALLLAVFALGMAVESAERLAAPRPIAFDAAILVAVLGLAVNVVSVVLLGGAEHADSPSDQLEQEHEHPDEDAGHAHHHHHHDHNLRAAYLHVLADALTSVLAIAALLGAKHLGWMWLDAVMGVVGAALVARWSWSLLRETSRVLLDRQAPSADLERVREALEAGSTDRVVDLHVWSIGPALRAACLTVVSDAPASPRAYKARLPQDLGLVHVTVEVHACQDTP